MAARQAQSALTTLRRQRNEELDRLLDDLDFATAFYSSTSQMMAVDEFPRAVAEGPELAKRIFERLKEGRGSWVIFIVLGRIVPDIDAVPEPLRGRYSDVIAHIIAWGETNGWYS